MRAATQPDGLRRHARLMVVDERGISHQRRSELPSLLRPGDLVVANDAATLPASLSGLLAQTGAAIEVRLAGCAALSPDEVSTFVAVVFGAGDYRTATEHRPLPPRLYVGDQLLLGPLRARVQRILDHPRLIELRFEGAADQIWRGLARHGRPIQYAYVARPLSIGDTWTRVAARPLAFEPPSAGFILDWSMLQALRERRVRFATITHAAGISSTGDAELDARLPLDEPYRIPPSTASAINATRDAGGRVIAIGTTVVRALEHAAAPAETVRSGAGLATGRLGPDSRLRVADAIVSGMHEPGTSHYRLLQAFVDEDLLADAIREADTAGYAAHEFGDSMMVWRSPDSHFPRKLRVVFEKGLLA